MPRKKIPDVHLAMLTGKANAARAEFEKWYSRLGRAFRKCEKVRRRLLRLSCQIGKREAATDVANPQTPRSPDDNAS